MRKGILALLIGGSVLCAANLAWAGDAAPKLPATDKAIMFVKASETAAAPGDTITVDTFITNATNLGLFQVQVKTTGGTKGRLIVESVSINKQRGDFVLQGGQVIDAADQKNKRAGGMLMSGSVNVDQPGYMATFTLRLSDDAQGTFKVNVSRGTESFINDASSAQLPFVVGEAAEITVGKTSRKRHSR